MCDKRSTLPLPMDEIEEWRPVVGWEDLYEVSSHGRVRRLPGTPWSPRGGVLKPRLQLGYHNVALSRNSNTQSQWVHRLVAKAFVPGWSPDRNFVNHISGNKLDNRPSNLEWTTSAENNRHAIRMGLTTITGKGEANGYAKLTDDIVRQIRKMHREGVVQRRIAEQFGLHWAHVNDIVHRRIWKHID